VIRVAVVLAVLLGEPGSVAAAAAPLPGPALAPIGAASAAPDPTMTPKPPLKEIGRVRALTPYCAAIEKHFNAIVAPMIENDNRIGAVDFTLGNLRAHFDDPARDLKLYDDRVNLSAYAGFVETSIPAIQKEVNELRAAEKLTTDPEEAKLAHDLAAQLQKSLDRQRQIGYDTAGVAQALLESSPGTKLLGDPLDATLQSERGDTRAQFQLELAAQEVRELGERTTAPGWQDVRDYLRLQRQRDRIGDAEGAAAALADRAYEHCSSPTTP
jgi:hypothetical protein